MLFRSFQPAFGLVLRPEIAAITMAGSSFLVAVNALTLKRLRLPKQVPGDPQPATIDVQSGGPAGVATTPAHR